jgi:opacity protein-like surface antigen
MNIRPFALASVAFFALSAPALAADGWYLGLGAAYSHQDAVRITGGILPANTRLHNQDGFLGVGSFGYKFENGFRLEFEAGISDHDQRKANPPFAGTLSGDSQVRSAMVNLVYDWRLGDRWSISTGAGIGDGAYRTSITDSLFPTLRVIRGQHNGWMWQGIAGINYQFDPNIQLFVDYRYRSDHVDRDYGTDFVALSPIHVHRVDDQAAMIGIRWFTDEEAAPLPPPPAPVPPPPPPVAPPPVKTFIVFFDFDKSNLTDKAQEVVAEAVRTAKANGFVKVLVTGHTDTVGSDSYNQALSVRRAQSVKDEMVREGLDGGGIEIVGKSFHDPLVATGPGVREPQNRRAVIDLGG